MNAVTRTALAVTLTVACASALASVVAPLCVTRPEPGVTLTNFLRIREGMTEDEVAAVFGRGPDACIGGRGYSTCCWNAGACSARRQSAQSSVGGRSTSALAASSS